MRHLIIISIIILAVILVPFFLFQDSIEIWTQQWLHNPSQNKSLAAGIIFLLLASDIVLPIPSSVISTGAGIFLGVLWGTISSFTGMTAGAVVGYFLGKNSVRMLRWMNDDARRRMEIFFQQNGEWSIIIARPVPVLAEASVLFAGMSKMNFTTFLVSCSLSNLAISFVYALIGAFAVSTNSFLIAFAAAILLPVIAKFAVKPFVAMRSQ